MRRVNYVLLGCILGGALILGLGVHLLHGFQVQRNAIVFLEAAKQALARLDEAIQAGSEAQTRKAFGEMKQQLDSYHQLRPEDLDTIEEFAGHMQSRGQSLLEKATGEMQAQGVAFLVSAFRERERLLRLDPARNDARRQQVELAMLLARLAQLGTRDPGQRSEAVAYWYSSARTHLEELLKAFPKDTQLWERLGRAQAAVGREKEAAESFRRAIELSPERVEAYGLLAHLLRHSLNQPHDADSTIEQMIKSNPDSLPAHRIAANYWREQGEIDKTSGHALRMLELEPDNRDGLLIAAQCALVRATRAAGANNRELVEESLQEAQDYLDKGTKLYPRDADLCLAAAEAQRLAGRPENAIQILRNGLKANQGEPNLLVQLADMLLNMQRTDEAQQLIEQIKKARLNEAIVNYLQGRIEYNRGNWRAALQSFEKAAPGLTPMAQTLKQAYFWIGRCHRELGNPDEERRYYRQALNLDRDFAPAKSALANSLMASGRIDDALTEYEMLVRSGRGQAASPLFVARMLLVRALRTPPADRNWAQVEAAVEEAARELGDAPQVIVLRAEVLWHQMRAAEAEKLLLAARDKSPQTIEFWTMLIALAQRQQKWEEADKLLQQAEDRLGDRMELRLMKAQQLFFREGKQSSAKLMELARNVERFSEEEQVRLWQGLLEISIRLNDVELTRQLCQSLVRKQPKNVQVQFLLFEFALRTGDKAGMEAAHKAIRDIEGQGPYWHYCEAVRLTLPVTKSDDPRLTQALQHLAEAGAARPSWSRVPLLTGTVYYQQGNRAKALEQFLKAIELGELNPTAMRRAVQLLSQEGRFEEALGLIRLLEARQVPLSDDLQRLRGEISYETGDLETALEFARKSAAESTDFREHVWLGHLLDVARRRALAEQNQQLAQQFQEEAEKVLLRAVELNDGTAETWVPLIRFYSAAGMKQQAAKAIEDARNRLPQEEAALALAQCYDALGQLDAAYENYRAALKRAPDHPAVIRAAADFYWRTGRVKLAIEQLNRLLDGKVQTQPADVAWARRLMAVILVQQGGYKNLLQAEKLVEQNLASEGKSDQDLRLKVLVLNAFGTKPKLAEARKVLEDLVRGRARPAADDRFDLARVYLTQGDWTGFTNEMRALLTAHSREPRYLAVYVAALMDNKELGEAERYLDSLERVAPNTFETVGLRAEALFRRGKHDQAMAVLKQYVDRPDAIPSDRAVRLQLVADKLDVLARRTSGADRDVYGSRYAREAEIIFRQFVDERPNQEILLAAFLARQNKLDEALSLVERLWQRADPVMLAASLGAVMRSEELSKTQFQRGESVCLEALRRFDRALPLVIMLADAYTIHGRFADAESLYREVLRDDPNNYAVMNNLAMLLAVQGIKLDEALKLANRAAEIAGPIAQILDTRSVIYMAMGDPHKALADLREAIDSAVAPTRLFHQAQALEQLGETREAALMFRKALDRGLRITSLLPPERGVYQRLEKLLQDSRL